MVPTYRASISALSEPLSLSLESILVGVANVSVLLLRDVEAL